MKLHLLVLSNGAGEDAIAASILQELQPLRPDLRIAAFPLVGAGAAYGRRWPLWGDGGAPPSLGLSNASWKLWLRDLRAGLLGRVASQWWTLRSRHAEIGSVLAVGDLFPVVLSGLAASFQTYFVGTAKSVHHHAYSRAERWLLRRFARECVVRDAETAAHLQQHGVAATYLGNPMMDATVPRGEKLPFEELPVLALFPGSRVQAPAELPRLLSIWRRLYLEVPCQAAVAVAEGFDAATLCAGCSAFRLDAEQLCADGLPPVLLVRDALGDLLGRAQLALGQAGTAHEQAAGAGVPVVALHPNPRGPLGWYRGRQKGLLGDALTLVSSEDEAVLTLARLLRDQGERRRLAAVGRARMGGPGGARRIAAWLAERV